MTEKRSLSALWEAALRDAAELFASFITPETLSLASISVTPAGTNPGSAFLDEIQRRLDLGRTMQLVALLDGIDTRMTDAFRHEITVSKGVLRGKLHVPSYIRERARGHRDQFPVIRARRLLYTPENLLISEAMRLGLVVARSWAARRGAEGQVGASLLSALTVREAGHPWADLRNAPRPPLGQLIPIVRGRHIAGVIAGDHPVLCLCDLLEASANNVIAFEAAVAPLAFAATQDSGFADRLFELLCLAWLISALAERCSETLLTPANLVGGGGQPIFEGTDGPYKLRLYFQTSLPLGATRWRWLRPRKLLRSIPDILLEAERDGIRRIVVVDAKNRPRANPSSVAYKMIGYKENIRLDPFFGIAIFPTAGNRRQRKMLRRDDHRVWLVKLPLPRARRIIRRAVASLGDWF